MDYKRVMTFAIIFILVTSGISVMVQSKSIDSGGDEIIAEGENEKNLTAGDDSVKNISIKKEVDSKTEQDGYFKEDFTGPGNDITYIIKNGSNTFRKKVNSHMNILENRSEIIDGDKNIEDDESDQYSNSDKNIIIRHNSKEYHKLRDDPVRKDEEMEAGHQKGDNSENATQINTSTKLTSTGSDELILDLYNITFQGNMTAVSIDAEFKIYKVEIGGMNFTADDIRNSPDTDEIMENLSSEMGDIFNDSVSSAFPEENKDFHSSTYDVGSSPGPVNVYCHADVYLLKSSFGFDESNDQLDLSDLIYGTTKMGASISKDINLKVKPGHNSTYRINVPEPFITTSTDTWGRWSDYNHTFDDGKARTSTWIYNNSEGSRDISLSRTINITDEDPLDLKEERVNATSFLDMNSFENVDITDTINLYTLDITDYNKEGTEQPLLPSSVTGLEVITSDGIRLMLDNGLTNLQEIKNRSLNETMESFEQSIENIFGEKPDLRFEWDMGTVSGYDVDHMTSSPPIRCYFNTTEPVGFTNSKMDIPQKADLDEVINEILKLDAIVNPEFYMIIQDGMYFTLNILAPYNVMFKDSEQQSSGRYLYHKEIDNREGNNPLPYFSLNISWSGTVRKYNSEDIGADIDLDMMSFDNIPMNISMELTSIKVSRYDKEFTVPSTVRNLNYIDGNFIRVAVRNDIFDLSTIYNKSIKDMREDVKADLKNLFGREVLMEFSWESLEWKQWSAEEWKERSPSLGPFKGYLETTRPARFDPTSLGLPKVADMDELVEEVLRLDAELRVDFNLTVENNRWMKLTIKAPENIGIKQGVNESDRGKRTWYKEGGFHTLDIELFWIGSDIRSYKSEDITASGLIDIKTFNSVYGSMDISIGVVNVSSYGAQFEIPGSVHGLDFIDGDFIRVAVRNGLVELSDIYEENIKQSKMNIEEELADLIGQNVTLNFSWEDRSWEKVDSYREEYPDGLGELQADLSLNENLSFTPDSFDLPEDARVGDIVRSVLKLNTTIDKDISMNITGADRVQITVRTPEDIKIENGTRYEGRWSRTYNLNEEENVVPLKLRYDGEVREVSKEKVFVNGTLDMRDLDNIDVKVSISIFSINISDYGGNLSIPDSVEGLEYVDYRFLRDSVENGLLEWNNITDEMNESVDEFEAKIPDLLGDIQFKYRDPGKASGQIIRYYEAKDFKLNVTPDKEGAYIDHELIDEIMNSGAIVDFEIPQVDNIDEDYILNFKLATPQFMNLYNGSDQLERKEGFYNIDLRNRLNGSFHSGVEGPTEESIKFNMEVDLHKLRVEPSPLKLSYGAHAKSKIDARVEILSVELPDDIADSLPEEIRLNYATTGLIIQAESHGLFEKQEILGMLRNGSGVDDFEGMNQTLRDALDNDDIGIDITFEKGTWQYNEEGDRPIIVNMDSEFKIHVAGSQKNSALDLHTVNMGDIEIPSIQGIDTKFRILFPKGVRADVKETSNVKTGWTDDGRHYVEVQTSGDSNESVTITPNVVLTEKLFFGGDLFLFGISLRLILVLLISLIILGAGIKVGKYYFNKKGRVVKKSMKEAREEENDPDKWLDYISEEDKDRFNITQQTLFEQGLQDELIKQRKKAGIENETLPTQEEDIDEGEETDEENRRADEDNEGELTDEDIEGYEGTDKDIEEGVTDEDIEESKEETKNIDNKE